MAIDPFSLKGKLALITGWGTGIGLGIAKAFIRVGAKVVITGRRQEPLEEAVAVLGLRKTTNPRYAAIGREGLAELRSL